MAFQGATNLLKYIEAINTEVNYEELYQDCALIDQLDEFLGIYGFERKATTTPYHRSWGDGFYVKMQIHSDKSIITMSTLGKNGRFANQLFQYAFLKIYAKKHNLEVRTPPWIGQYLFGHKDPPISGSLPEFKETTNELADAIIPNAKRKFENVDFWGYFQYHTSYYAPDKEYFRSLFKSVPEIEKQMNRAVSHLRSKGKTVVGMHLRRGDYGRGCFFVAPSKWYKNWLQDLWSKLDEPVLFIASDEPEKVLDDFAQYNPITTKQLCINLPKAEFYPDFYILSKCDIVSISNSSFSFVACMLNEQGRLFYRPRLSAEALIPFDPWNSETVFRDEKLSKIFYSAKDIEHLRQENCIIDVTKQHIKKAVKFLYEGNICEALDYIDGACYLCPTLAQEDCEQTLLHLNKTRLQQICTEARKKLVTGPKHLGANLLLKTAQGLLDGPGLLAQGIAELRSSQPERALSYFNKALAAVSKLPNMQFARATALVQLGKLGLAKEACLAELKIEPEHDGAKRLLQRIDQAIAEYNQLHHSSTEAKI